MFRRRSILTQKEIEAIEKRLGPYSIFMILGFTLLIFGILTIIDGSSGFRSFGIAEIVIGSIMILATIIFKILHKINCHQMDSLLLNSNMSYIDSMNGEEFEKLVCALYRQMGYVARLTKRSGDFGADVIACKDGAKIVIQTKRYTNKISISAIQEVASARSYYNANAAVIVTNNFYTEPAKKLAVATNVQLIDRIALAELIIKYVPTTPIDYDSVSLAKDNKKEEIIPPTVSKSNPEPLHLSTKYDNLDMRNKYNDYLYQSIEPMANKLFQQDKIDEAFTFIIDKLKEDIEYVNYNALHFFIIHIITDYYRYRIENDNVIDYVITLCKMDIELIPKLKNLNDVSMPALTKLAVIYEKQSRFAEAIEICNIGIENSFKDNGKSFLLRRLRLKTKLDKQAKETNEQ